MRVLAGALLAMLATGPVPSGAASFGMTLATRPLAAGSCTVVSTATIVAYDAAAARDVSYRFIRSDGTASRTAHLAFTGDGALAQSVRDRWTPSGASPWVALEITAPDHVRSQRVAITPRCGRPVVATNH
jgi:hypothetical protein